MCKLHVDTMNFVTIVVYSCCTIIELYTYCINCAICLNDVHSFERILFFEMLFLFIQNVF